MLYDKRWEEKELPATTTEPDQWRQLLLRAAEMIEEVGWCQGRFVEMQDGFAIGFCALGAINRANGSSTGEARWQAEYQLIQRLNSPSVECWNDANHRTKEEVVAKLRKVAAG